MLFRSIGPVCVACGCQPRKAVGWRQWLREMEQRGAVQTWYTGRDFLRLPDEARLTDAQLAARDARKPGKVIPFRGLSDAVDPHAKERERQKWELEREGWGA